MINRRMKLMRKRVKLMAISGENKVQQQEKLALPNWKLELTDEELEQLYNDQLVIMNRCSGED